MIGTSSQASLADTLGLDYSSLATITGELADRGLIERYRYENDRRRYVVELSERGTELLLAEADRAVSAGESKLVETLDPAERAVLDASAQGRGRGPALPAKSRASCLGHEEGDC